MRTEDHVCDLIVDILGGRSQPARASVQAYKAGDIAARPYLLGRNPLRAERRVVTEAYLLSRIRSGECRISLGPDAVITPLAQLLIDEGRIKIYE